MKQTRVLMGMPITVELVGAAATPRAIDDVFAYFTAVDERFSTYKATSEISRINSGELARAEASVDMQTVFQLAEQTRQETGGYFDIVRDGTIDPSGIATSGTYIRGQHIYNPLAHQGAPERDDSPHNRPTGRREIVSLSVIGPNIYEADRFATAAFAMGRDGIVCIERLPGFEGYEIDASGTATFTSGFQSFAPRD